MSVKWSETGSARRPWTSTVPEYPAPSPAWTRASRSRALIGWSGTGSARTVIGTSTTRATASATKAPAVDGPHVTNLRREASPGSMRPSDVDRSRHRVPTPRKPDLPAPGVGVGEPQQRRHHAQGPDRARHQEQRQGDLDEDRREDRLPQVARGRGQQVEPRVAQQDDAGRERGEEAEARRCAAQPERDREQEQLDAVEADPEGPQSRTLCSPGRDTAR